MLGAIIGDTVGSRFEFDNIHTKDFVFLNKNCYLTDDSIMTIALAEAIMEWEDDGLRAKRDYEALGRYASSSMRQWGRQYPDSGYGSHFKKWIESDTMGPYNSCGNGSAMRISPVGWVAESEEELKKMSKAVTEVTHNHLDGLKGAEATAMQIYLARKGATKNELREYEEKDYYPLTHDYKWLMENYHWQSLCNGTCQAAFIALYESESFEDAIRSSIAIGGDSDTIAAITGSIAEPLWGIDKKTQEKIFSFMDDSQKKIVAEFRSRYVTK